MVRFWVRYVLVSVRFGLWYERNEELVKDRSSDRRVSTRYGYMQGSADTEGLSGRGLGMLAGGTLSGHWAPATKFKERWAEMVGSTKNE